MNNWIVSIFSVFGALALCGFGGAVIGYWLPITGFSVEGFCAAFGVVSIAFLSAPKFKKQYAVLWFLIGAGAAYILLHPSNSRNETLLPLLSTYSGGLLVLVVVFLSKRRPANNK